MFFIFMELPVEIRKTIEEIASDYPLVTLKTVAKKLSDNYLNKKKPNDGYINDEVEVVAYAITRMPATFGALSFALSKSLELVNGSINSVIDIGTGTGNSIIACRNLISDKISMICMEKSPEMLNFCKKLYDNTSIRYINEDITKSSLNEQADLVIASYMFNELSDLEKRDALNKIISYSQKYILIVEPGTPEAYKQMMTIREYFIREGFNVIAPCPHQKECPLSKDDWCHFVSRVSRSKLHKLLKDGDVPYEDEKFTYLFLSRENPNTVDDRVLRHPIINKGNISITTCNKDCSLKQYLFTRKDKVKYKAAKKINAGDLLK